MLHQLLDIKKGIDEHPLIVGHIIKKGGVWRRFLTWQLIKPLSKSGRVVSWINDSKLKIYPGRASGTGCYYYGLMEYESMAFLYRYLNENDVFFDIGANVGVYTVLARNARKIVAFEPAKDTIGILKENVILNNMKNVTIEEYGVSDTKGRCFFSKNLDTTNHILDQREANVDCVEVNTVSLDGYCREKIIQPSVIKIDAEGGEEMIIRGASEILSNKDLNVIIMENFGNMALFEVMKAKGFGVYYYHPISNRVLEEAMTGGDNNCIFIRDIEVVKKQLQRKRRILCKRMDL